jgi:hypothetical protein
MDSEDCAQSVGDRVRDTDDILKAEWTEIRARRHAQRIIDRAELDETDPPAGAVASEPLLHPPRNIVGLALSGGGIRSATFNLGILQALSDAGLLRVFDYVSTVSGGGFIGGWWSAWLARTTSLHAAQGPRPLFPPEEGLELSRYRRQPDPTATVAADPIHHVRLFANYLTPRKGLLSPDVWRAAVIITRNIGLTWLVLLPLIFIAVLVAQAIVIPLTSADEFYTSAPVAGAVLRGRLLAALLPAAAVFGWFVVLSLVWLMLHRGNSLVQQSIALIAIGSVAGLTWQIVGSSAATPILLWLGGALGLTVYALWSWRQRPPGAPVSFVFERLRNRVTGVQGTLLASAVAIAAVFVAAASGHELLKYAVSLGDSWQEQLAGWSSRVAGLMATLGAVYTWLVGAPRGGAETRGTAAGPSRLSRIVLSMAPALVLSALLAVVAYVINAAVVSVQEAGGAQTIDRLFFGTTLIGIALTIGLAVSERPKAMQWWRWTPVVLALALTAVSQVTAQTDALIAAFIVSLLCAAGFAYFLRANAERGRADYLLTGASIALLVTCGLHLSFTDTDTALLLRLLLGASAFLATMMLALGWSVDPNNLSLHMFYKARLVRAYVGASNPRRGTDNDDITTSQDGDNVALRDLAPCATGVPYHLVNTTLNLAAGDDVTVAQRRAANFVMSRLHCGSARTGYRPTACYMGGDLSLGTAVAVSGAAASPNMGSQTPSTAVAMLMALLNVRLGFWAPTPHQSDWQASQARLWPFYLIREFFSRTTDQRAYCYLTDGGHFDNTGIYALVERGCRFIVVADCGADPDGVFDDLSNAVRRCRIDFQTEIALPGVDTLSRKTQEFDRRPFIVGKIKYSSMHLKALNWTAQQIKEEQLTEGVIVVVKPNLLTTLDLDARRYSQLSTDFPQETTNDQWYDEAQFESYRILGCKSMRALLDGNPALSELAKKDGTTRITIDQIAALFAPPVPDVLKT